MPDSRNKRVTINELGHAHELTFSVHHRRMLMFQPGIVELFLANLIEAGIQLQFDIWAYVVMPDHVHVLLWPRQEVHKMEEIRRRIKKPVAEGAFKLHPAWKPKMTVKRGKTAQRHFWQRGPGYDRNLYSPKAIKNAIDYIHRNPVRAGLAESPSDWPWSSARNYEGLPGEIPVVLWSEML